MFRGVSLLSSLIIPESVLPLPVRIAHEYGSLTRHAVCLGASITGCYGFLKYLTSCFYLLPSAQVSPSSSPVSPLPPSLADGDTASNSTSEPGTPTCVVPSPSFAARSKADAKQTAHYEVDILEVVDAQSSLSLTGVSGTASTGNESPTVGHSSSPQATTASSPRHDSTLLSAMDRLVQRHGQLSCCSQVCTCLCTRLCVHVSVCRCLIDFLAVTQHIQYKKQS